MLKFISKMRWAYIVNNKANVKSGILIILHFFSWLHVILGNSLAKYQNVYFIYGSIQYSVLRPKFKPDFSVHLT